MDSYILGIYWISLVYKIELDCLNLFLLIEIFCLIIILRKLLENEYQIYKFICIKIFKSFISINLQDVKLILNIYYLFGYIVIEIFIDIQDIDNKYFFV